MTAIQRLIGSRIHRCQAVIPSRGSHTSYWQLSLLVFGLFLDIFMTWSNIVKPPFWGYDSLMTECVLSIVQIWYATLKFMK